MTALPTLTIYAAAALAEIAGCFAVWAWWRLGASAVWLVPGVASLIAFGWLLAQIDSAFAGRAYAAYGGVYIVASVAWMWLAEGERPDRWDLTGGVVCLAGAALILLCLLYTSPSPRDKRQSRMPSSA